MSQNCDSTLFRQWHVENALMFSLVYPLNMQGFYSSKTPVYRWNLVRHLATKLQQENCILCGYITNSKDHVPLSKQLRHTLLQTFQWNKQLSGMTIITSALPQWLLCHYFRLCIPLKNPCTVCLTYTNQL